MRPARHRRRPCRISSRDGGAPSQPPPIPPAISRKSCRRWGVRHPRRAPGLLLYQVNNPSPPAQPAHVTLNHEQEFSEKVDVVYSRRPSTRSSPPTTRNGQRQIQAIPSPRRRTIAMPWPDDGVVLDNAGRPISTAAPKIRQLHPRRVQHVRSVTGQLNGRLNVDTIQSTDLESSRFSAKAPRRSRRARCQDQDGG